jgi:phage tail-like protein
VITDVWLNPITGTASMLGYSQAVDEFSHSLISFVQATIVEADRREAAVLYRFLYTMQDEWESIYGKILAVPDLYSPEQAPVDALEHLRYNVAIADNLNYIWGTLDELGKRRLIKNFIRFLSLRMTDLGLLGLFETMTGYPVEMFSYFDYQWLISGDGEFNMETALGEEETGFDPWLISEYHEAFGIEPESVAIIVGPTFSRYKLQIDAAVAAFLAEEARLPEKIRMAYKPTLETTIGFVVNEAGTYYVYGPPDYFFGQGALYSTDAEDFRVGFVIDQYIYDICVMDYEETLSHEMCQALAKFSRASHERVYIRYYRLIELFDEDNGDWTLGAGSSIDTDNQILILSSSSAEYVG